MNKTRFAARIIAAAAASAVLLGAGFAAPAQADSGWNTTKRDRVTTLDSGWNTTK